MTNASYEALVEAGTAVIADIFDARGLEPQVLTTELEPTLPGRRFAGPAFTIGGRAEHRPGQGDRKKLEAIDAIPPGAVAVWAGGDIRGVCCFGDLLATSMLARGCSGAIVDGGVRDSAFLGRELDLPILARYRTPAQGIGRWFVEDYGMPVRVRGALEDWITVAPGAVVVADEDGVVVVPEEMLPVVAGEIDRLTGEEEAAREEIRRGMPLLTAIEKYGHL